MKNKLAVLARFSLIATLVGIGCTGILFFAVMGPFIKFGLKEYYHLGPLWAAIFETIISTLVLLGTMFVSAVGGYQVCGDQDPLDYVFKGKREKE